MWTSQRRRDRGRETSIEKIGHRAKLQYYNGGGSKVKEQEQGAEGGDVGTRGQIHGNLLKK